MFKICITKLKHSIWYLCAYMLTVLFLSLALKHVMNNSGILLISLAVYLIGLVFRVYFTRRKNRFFKKAFLDVKEERTDNIATRFRRSSCFPEFKAEMILSFIVASVFVAGAVYYLKPETVDASLFLFCLAAVVVITVAFAVANYLIWLRCCFYWIRSNKRPIYRR